MADAQLRLDDTKGDALRGGNELQQLVAEHHELDARIHHLSTSSYLTNQQQFEEVQLKKAQTRVEGSDRNASARRARAGPR
jgi:uncharacterized protein YdcH (DUF465 family)